MKKFKYNKNELNKVLDKVIELNGDLTNLNDRERKIYYYHMCDKIGLDPETRPFGYFNLDGKVILYATKSCSDQLRYKHGISTKNLEVYFHNNIVYCKATIVDKEGREETAIGAEILENDAKLNVADKIMKAETKAKRRATLSMFAIGMLDETEIYSIQNKNYESNNNGSNPVSFNKNDVNHNQSKSENQKNEVIKEKINIRDEDLEKFKNLPENVKEKIKETNLSQEEAISICKKNNWSERAIIIDLDKLIQDIKMKRLPDDVKNLVKALHMNRGDFARICEQSKWDSNLIKLELIQIFKRTYGVEPNEEMLKFDPEKFKNEVKKLIENNHRG
jgi:hypothetical protein